MEKVVIVDDDPVVSLYVKKIIDSHGDFEVVASFTDPLEARLFLQKNDVDLLLLDMMMPELSGFELLESLDITPAVIVVTSSPDFAIEGYQYQILDYLVKPVKAARLFDALKKYTSNGSISADGDNSHLFIKDGKSLVKVNINNIQYIEGMGDYLKVYCKESGMISTLMTFGKIYELLPNSKFARIHKSYIVNISKIDKIQDHTVKIDKHAIPVGRSYRKEFYEMISL